MSPLKFFRKYNKWILVVGASVLMVAFVIPQLGSMFAPQPGDQVEGRIDGQKVRVGDLQAAAGELSLLGAVSPLLPAVAVEWKQPTGFGERGGEPSPLKWILMQHEARSLGLGASQYEVDLLLKAFGTNPKDLASRLNAGSAGRFVTPEQITRAFGKWIMIQHYQDIITGARHVPSNELFQQIALAHMEWSRMPFYRPEDIAQVLHGGPRVSAPLLKRFVYDQEAQVKVTILPVTGKRDLEQEPDPSTEAMQKLFDQYKDVLPGEGEPYGFGYKLPSSVRLEYLRFPFSRVRDTIAVEEADAYEYYQKHRENYKIEEPDDPAKKDEKKDDLFTPLAPEADTPAPKQYKSYEEVAGQIRDTLRDEKAAEQVARMAQAAYAMLKQQAGSLKRKDLYYVTEDTDWKPMPLAQVAEKIQEQYGILPDVIRHDDRWLDREELRSLAGFGEATLQRSSFDFVSAVDYAFAVKELIDITDLDVPENIQVNLPSKPLRHIANRDYYVFRVTDAREEQVPETMEPVRERLLEDARKLAVYNRLKADADTWVRRALPTSLEDLASQLVEDLKTPPAFPRRRQGRNRQFAAPDIENVGDDKTFVSRVFEAVKKLPTDKALADLPVEQRIIAVPDDRQQQLLLVRLESYEPITQKQYEERAGSFALGAVIREAMLGDASRSDPFTIDALSERVGYEPERDDAPDEAEDADTSEAATASR